MYSDQGLIAELGSGGAIQRTYGFRPDRTWMTDPLYLRDDVGNTYYCQNDHLGTPQKLTNVAGQSVWAQESSAFGDARVVVSTVENPLRFAGQYFDGENKFHYNYHRTYDPLLGRYLESDPIGIEGGLNTYGYVTQNPLSYTDPLGHCKCKAIPTSKKYPDPNGSDSVKTGFIFGYSTLVKCDYTCTTDDDNFETVPETMNIETWFRPGERTWSATHLLIR